MHVSRLSIGSQKLGSQDTEQESEKKEPIKKSVTRSSPSTEEAIFYQLKTRRPGNPSASPEYDQFNNEDARETSGEQNTRDFLNQDLQDDHMTNQQLYMEFQKTNILDPDLSGTVDQANGEYG